jgi:hypothetical protein
MNKELNILHVLGYHNSYVARIVNRSQKPIIIDDNYHDIDQLLCDQIIININDTDTHRLIINTILREKLADRVNIDQKQRYIYVLSILTLVLPFITSGITLLITRIGSIQIL